MFLVCSLRVPPRPFSLLPPLQSRQRFYSPPDFKKDISGRVLMTQNDITLEEYNAGNQFELFRLIINEKLLNEKVTKQ